MGYSKNIIIILLVSLSLIPISALAQEFQGTIVDGESGEPLVGACFSVLGYTIGTCTNVDGYFTLMNTPKDSFSIALSYLGYQSDTMLITDPSTEIKIEMLQEHLVLSEVEVVSDYSKIKQEVALTVESMGLQEIESNSESSFYDILASMREADMMTVSFGVKVVNTRGFNSSTPVRSLQLIDGVDNASPGLNFPLGNFMGLPDLDVEGVDLVIGASSAYFGPGAFNGVVNMRTKDPFKYQGIDIQLKGGMRNYFEGAIRAAKAFKNKKGDEKFAAKLTMSYQTVRDWEANDQSPSFENLRDSIYADNPGGYDAINKYGDEPSAIYTSPFEQFRHPGLGTFFRTGYWETDLASYDSYNIKSSVGIHYKPRKDWEIIATTNFGIGTTVMQLDNRLSLNDVWAMNNKLEVKKKDKFFIRFYTTKEDAGDTYDIITTGQILQSRWKSDGSWLNEYKNYWFRNINPLVKELPGFPSIGPAPDFYYDFDQANKVLEDNADMLTLWHAQARAAQDGAYLIPGSDEFNHVFNNIVSTKVSEGGTKYVDKSRLFHGHAEYKFKPRFVDEFIIGGNFRLYAPYSEGTIFVDTSGTSFTTYEFGGYLGFEKFMADDRLKLNFATRIDKHENYDYLISPALSLQYILSPLSSIRLSVSSALRNPTLIEQYFYFRVGSAILLGNINGYENLVTLNSFENYLKTDLNQDSLVYFDEPPVVPEKATAMELAFSTVLFEDKLDVKSTLYLNRYRDFLGNKIGLQLPFIQGFPGQPIIYRFAANAKDITYTVGFSTGLTYVLSRNIRVTGNYSWNKIFIDSDDPLIPSYNTPEHKFNLGFNIDRFKLGTINDFGFGTNFRWVEGYKFESSPQFSGEIPAQIHLNAQISKRIPKLGTTIKLSGSNLLNRQQNGLYGGPKVGRFIFLSWHLSL